MAATAWLRPKLVSPRPFIIKSFDVEPPVMLYRRMSSAMEADLIRMGSELSEIFETGTIQSLNIHIVYLGADTCDERRTVRVCSIEDVHSRIMSELNLTASTAVRISFGGETIDDDGTNFHEVGAEDGATFVIETPTEDEIEVTQPTR